MSPRDFVLPPEALALVKQVADLETRAERTRAELAADLVGIRQAAEQEVAEARKVLAAQRREAVQELERVREAVAVEHAWVLRLYEWHFPWLTDLRDLEEEQSFVAGTAPKG